MNAVELDPYPWVHPYHSFCDKCVKRVDKPCVHCMFHPRALYSQNREDYS